MAKRKFSLIHIDINYIKGVSNSVISFFTGNSSEEKDNTRIITCKDDLTENDCINFIGKISLPEKLIKRTLTKDILLTENDYDHSEHEYTLDEVLDKENAKILLIGSDGMGKSIELKRLALSYWKNRDDNFIPIFKSLRNFTQQDKIEDFLNVDWGNLNNILFIFDGIDEVSDIEHFESVLQNFIEKLDFRSRKTKEDYDRLLKNKDKNRKDEIIERKVFKYKLLLSCRTNIFSKDLDGILHNLDVFTLNKIKIEEAINDIKLETKYLNFDVKDISSSLSILLQNPSSLKVVKEYVKTKKELPKDSLVELWDMHINKRLKDDSRFKFFKKRVKVELIKLYSKKISLINELTRVNVITEDNFIHLFKEDFDKIEDFKKNSFLMKDFKKDVWFFNHKNIQEYFASKYIADLDSDNIIELIKVKDKNITKSNLFSTITFLIGALEKNRDKFDSLISWLMEYEPEFLFKIESERISDDIRETVFKKYFTEKCLNTTLWLTMNRNIQIDKMAEFSDCPENFNFLLEVIDNPETHFRPKISAIDVLSYFKIPQESVDQIKGVFYSYLENDDVSKNFKARIIDFFGYNKKFKKDEVIINEIVSLFKNETNNQICSSVLKLIENSKDVNLYADYIIEEFLRANDYKERDDKQDNVHRGNGYRTIRLVLKLDSPDNFLIVLENYLNSSSNYHFSNTYFESLEERIIHFCNDVPDYLISIIKKFKNDVPYFTHESLLYSVISKTNKIDEVLFFLLKNNKLRDVSYFITKLVNRSNIDKVSEVIKVEERDEVEYFRNFLGNRNSRDLAVRFNDLMIEKGVVFLEEVFTADDELKRRKEEISMKNTFFKDFFDKEKLIGNIHEFYSKKGISSLELKELHFYQMEERKRLNYRYYGFDDSTMCIIQKVLYFFDKPMTSKEIETSLNDDFFIFDVIKTNIITYNKSKWEYKINDINKQKIIDWCLKESNRVDFEKIIKIHSRESFSYISDSHKRIEVIFFFQKKFNFELSKDFLLNIIEFYGIENYDGSVDKYEYIINQINDIELFNSKIIDNINKGNLLGFQLDAHINYALQNDLTETYGTIRDLLIKNDPVIFFNGKHRLELYVDKTNDMSVLKECCLNNETRFYWDSISIMMKKHVEVDFCYEKAIEYFAQTGIDKDYKSEAIGVLFKLNKVEALKILLKEVKEQNVFSGRRFISIHDYKDYTAITDFSIIEKLFNAFYSSDSSGDMYSLNDYRTFFKQYLLNITKEEDNYNLINEILIKIKINKEEKKEELFYINLLLEEIRDNYLSGDISQIKFKDALKLVESFSNN